MVSAGAEDRSQPATRELGSSAAASGWARIARRVRVPVGFAFAVLYLWLARPTPASIAVGAAIIAAGLWLRALASGHVRKNTELTTTGPYAYTRNPLYLGSAILGAGFAVAARSLWVAGLLVVMFVALYLPVVISEEAYLRAHFPEFSEYARRVPRFLPRLQAQSGGSFSRELYLKHREYNAVLGAAGMLVALLARLWWRSLR